jgi:ADP-heptose:LPS heptosyltransferase
MNVLLIVDGGLVEVLQASPLLRSLVASLEGVQVTVACAPVAAPVAAQMPGVTEAVATRALAPGGASPESLLRAWTALRRRRFHAAAICSTGMVAPLLAYFAGVPRRAGVASGMATLLLTDHVERQDAENRAATWLRLAPALGVEHQVHQPSFDPGAEARRVAEERMLASGFEDGRLMIAVAPGNGFADPLPALAPRALAWEPERYAHLCNQLTRRHGAGIVLLGSAEDRAQVEVMLMDVESPALDLCGELGGLAEAAAVLERCDLLVCGDSPLLHLAAAVGTPSVGLFGPTEGLLRAPYGPEHRVVQALRGDPGVTGGAGAGAVRRSRRDAVGAAPEGGSLRQIRVDDVLAGIESPLQSS